MSNSGNDSSSRQRNPGRISKRPAGDSRTGGEKSGNESKRARHQSPAYGGTRSSQACPSATPSIGTPSVPLSDRDFPVTTPTPLQGDLPHDNHDFEELNFLLTHMQDARNTVSQDAKFTFAVPPHLHETPLHHSTSAEEVDRICSLDPNFEENSVFIGYYEHLMRARRHARDSILKAPSQRVVEKAHLLEHLVQTKLAAFRSQLAREWQRQFALKNEPYLIDTTRHFRNKLRSIHPAVLVMYLTVASLYLLSNVSQDDCRFALCSYSLAAQIMFAITARSAENPFENTLSDVVEIVNQLGLAPRFVTFACCVKCFSISLFDPEDDSISTQERCTNPGGDSICNTMLYAKKTVLDGKKKETTEKYTPRREFIYQPPQERISQYYAQPHLEPYLKDDPCRRRHAGHSSDDPPDIALDIWDAPGLRDFRFTDNKRFTDSADEDRLVFSLNMDGLNPETNKQAGKVLSIGALYLVCLNLPSAIRYRLENMYLVGIIPGPQLPSKHELNYLLRPLIDDFLLLWESGFYVSRTHSRPLGVRVRAAIVPLVCDLPAARHMSGFASYAHTKFCSECKLHISEINNLDVESWPLREWDEHMEAATLWRDAETGSQQRKLYKENGVRWSELLRLPYWDPTKYTVIDSMHAFYLRLLQHHIRAIWGMDINIDDSKGFTYSPSISEPGETALIFAHHTIRRGDAERVRKLPKNLLFYLCREYGIAVDEQKSRENLIGLLLHFRIEQNWWTEDGRHVLSAEDGVEPFAILKDGTTRSNDAFWHAGKTQMKKFNKDDLALIFRQHVLPGLNPSLTDAEVDRLSKGTLLTHIQQKRFDLQIVTKDGTHVAAGSKRPKNNCANILGLETLRAIRDDMNTLNRPSWQPNGPRWPGEAKFGKFTAAQWKTFCLVNLPVTLTRLWGHFDQNDVRRRMLDNFMYLITAIKLGTMDEMHDARIEQYELNIRQYLSTLLDLFPGTTITPYQHLALHFGRHLKRWGPVHSWRCFPFERYNHVLQSFPTNHKFGELEKTMFKKFCAAQQIRAVLSQEDRLPALAQPIVELFNKNYRHKYQMNADELFFDDPEYQPTPTRTNSAAPPASLDANCYFNLQQYIYNTDMHCTTTVNAVCYHSSIQRFGQSFSTLQHHRNNSHVIFKTVVEATQAGVIRQIFSHVRQTQGTEVSEYFAIVSRYEELSQEDSQHDVYRQYSAAAGRLVYNVLSNDVLLVPFSRIQCHFASQYQRIGAIARPCLLVLPLDRR